MKKTFLLIISSLFLSHYLSAQVLEFDIINHTGVDLYGIYVGPSESDEWGDDILPNEIFSNDSQVTVEIPDDFGDTCSFDILVSINEDEESTITFSNADLCKIISITLFDEGYYEVVWIE
jgi:hypothetical protein